MKISGMNRESQINVLWSLVSAEREPWGNVAQDARMTR